MDADTRARTQTQLLHTDNCFCHTRSSTTTLGGQSRSNTEPQNRPEMWPRGQLTVYSRLLTRRHPDCLVRTPDRISVVGPKSTAQFFPHALLIPEFDVTLSGRKITDTTARVGDWGMEYGATRHKSGYFDSSHHNTATAGEVPSAGKLTEAACGC